VLGPHTKRVPLNNNLVNSFAAVEDALDVSPVARVVAVYRPL